MSESIGKRIQQLRKEKGLTQEALAEQVGVTPQAVSKWENGYACPDISILPRLAEVLGVTTDELLTGTQTQTEDRVVTGEVVDETPKEKKKNFTFNWQGAARGSGIWFGLLIVAIGVILLLSKVLPDFPYSPWSLIWPLMILFVGISTLSGKISSLFGWIVSAAGVYFLLNNLGVIPTLENGSLIPAALVIVLGLYLVVQAIRHFTHKKTFHGEGPKNAHNDYSVDDGRFSCDLSFGDGKRVFEESFCRGGDADVSFGSLTLDLRGVQTFSDDACLDADVSFGSLIVLLPKTVRLVEEKDLSFAATSTHGCADADAPYKLNVNGDVSFGSIDFRYED